MVIPGPLLITREVYAFLREAKIPECIKLQNRALVFLHSLGLSFTIIEGAGVSYDYRRI
jgi:hypothetical protein